MKTKFKRVKAMFLTVCLFVCMLAGTPAQAAKIKIQTNSYAVKSGDSIYYIGGSDLALSYIYRFSKNGKNWDWEEIHL